MSRIDAGAWPLLDDPRDPWAEPFPDDDLGYGDLVGLAADGAPPEAAYRRAALALQGHLSALLRGAIPLDPHELGRLARAAHIPIDDGRVDRRPPVVAPYRASEEMICRSALAQEPAAGLFGPDAALGAWAIRARHDAPRDRATLAHALAHWAAGRPTPIPPIRRWRRANVAPDARDRRAVEAVVRAPISLWRAERRPGAWALTDTIGLAPHRDPDRAVDLTHAAGFGVLADGAPVLARLVPIADGSLTAFAPLVLPAWPRPDAVQAAVAVLLTHQRLRARRATRDDALRDRAADLCRLLHEACTEAPARVGPPTPTPRAADPTGDGEPSGPRSEPRQGDADPTGDGQPSRPRSEPRQGDAGPTYDGQPSGPAADRR